MMDPIRRNILATGAAATAMAAAPGVFAQQAGQGGASRMAIPARCQSIADNLAEQRTLLADLQSDLNTTTDPQEKSRIRFLMRPVQHQIGLLNTQLGHCINPPPPPPDLLPSDFVFRTQPGGTAFDFALNIENTGAGAATGPFKVTLGVDYYTYEQDPPLLVFRELDINVPASLTIAAGATYTTDYWTNIPILHRAGGTMARYEFYALVESNEGNNSLQQVRVF
jgi:hypothetical protein